MADVQRTDETTVTFLPDASTATEDVIFEADTLLQDSGIMSAQYDLGVGPRTATFKWRAFVQMSSAPAVGEVIRVYLRTSDGTHDDNDDATTTVSAEDKLANCTYIGNIVMDEAQANVEFVGKGTIEIEQRYIEVIFWNACATADTSTDADENGFHLTPITYGAV